MLPPADAAAGGEEFGAPRALTRRVTLLRKTKGGEGEDAGEVGGGKRAGKGGGKTPGKEKKKKRRDEGDGKEGDGKTPKKAKK